MGPVILYNWLPCPSDYPGKVSFILSFGDLVSSSFDVYICLCGFSRAHTLEDTQSHTRRYYSLASRTGKTIDLGNNTSLNKKPVKLHIYCLLIAVVHCLSDWDLEMLP